MSTGESGRDDVRGQLQQGITEISEAYNPLVTGINNANSLATEFDEVYSDLNEVASFVEFLGERVSREVVERFTTVDHHYGEAAGLILPALEGASENNQHATNARKGANELAMRGQEALKSLGPIDDENIRNLAGHLAEALRIIRVFNGAIGNAKGWGQRLLDDNHTQTEVAVQLYLEVL